MEEPPGALDFYVVAGLRGVEPVSRCAGKCLGRAEAESLQPDLPVVEIHEQRASQAAPTLRSVHPRPEAILLVRAGDLRHAGSHSWATQVVYRVPMDIAGQRNDGRLVVDLSQQTASQNPALFHLAAIQ